MNDTEARQHGFSKYDDVILAAKAKYESMMPDQQAEFIKLLEVNFSHIAEVMLVPDDELSPPTLARLTEMRRRRAVKAAR